MLIYHRLLIHISICTQGKSLDFDLVTLICCKPSETTIERLKESSGLPVKVEEHMRGQAAICLTAKVDKTGVGNKKVDLCLAMSHDSFLKKFQGLVQRIAKTPVMYEHLITVSQSYFRLSGDDGNLERFVGDGTKRHARTLWLAKVIPFENCLGKSFGESFWRDFG